VNARACLALLAAVGCGDDSVPPPVPMDVGTRDAARRDGGGADANRPDGDRPDVMRRDTGAPLDVGFDSAVTVMDAAPSEDPCEGYVEPGCGGGCPLGTVCADDVCGGRACVPGRPCLVAADCGGAECVGADPAGDVRGICAASMGPCGSSLDCPMGFACEDGSCVNRRIPCFVVADRCPRGYVCAMDPGDASEFCVPAMVRCTSDAQCEVGLRCRDVDGDGLQECIGSELCETNADCRDEGRCGVEPSSTTSACMLDGACGGDSGCAPDRHCVDLTGGDAAPRCELSGSCASNADCPEGQVCAAPALGLAPTCLGGV